MSGFKILNPENYSRAKIGYRTLTGAKDKNGVDIQQGLAISLFAKYGEKA